MKKLIITFGISLTISWANAQQFSFQIFFTDAVGNKDTIIFGYDSLATGGIDASFGEINIISAPTDSLLDVRFSDALDNFGNGTFNTKKQIVPFDCSPLWPSHAYDLDIYTKHWPVTATWNKSLFGDACRKGSIFTSFHPGGWWDVGCSSNLYTRYFFSEDSVTFTSNAPAYKYVKAGDTISVFWAAFGNPVPYDDGIGIAETAMKVQQIRAFPNPCAGKVTIEVPSGYGDIKSVEIFSAVGQRVMDLPLSSSIDMSGLEEGLYYIVVTNSHHNKITGKLVKNRE